MFWRSAHSYFLGRKHIHLLEKVWVSHQNQAGIEIHLIINIEVNQDHQIIRGTMDMDDLVSIRKIVSKTLSEFIRI